MVDLALREPQTAAVLRRKAGKHEFLPPPFSFSSLTRGKIVAAYDKEAQNQDACQIERNERMRDGPMIEISSESGVFSCSQSMRIAAVPRVAHI